ncbi:MAG: pyridoxal phosphate-dependent aminotransferase, partial [Aquificae bacterium]|nr:pyridoxal phosphate-dependent aminotransferase [Aquificota bacterium]
MEPKLSKRVKTLKPSPTLAISAKAKELKAKGVPVIGFGAGEPDFDTPEFIKEAAIKALREGKTKYAPAAGIPELREALAEKFKVENGVEYKPSEVVVSAGAKNVLFLLFMALLDEGDEVLVPAPYWVSYTEQIKLFGGVPVEVPTEEERNFVLTVDDLRPFVSDRTKVLVLNSPNNPTGAVVDEKNLKEIAEFCLERGILIISDECYEAFTYDGVRHTSIASFGEEVKKITFTVNAFSKTYSMTGWRVGFVGCPNEDYAKVLANLNSQSISNVTTFAQYGALEALKNPEGKKFVERMRTTFERRRDLMLAKLNEIPEVKVNKPKGAFYVFPNFRNWVAKFENDLAFTEYLLEEAKVAVVPGSAFGYEGFLRLSYCNSDDEIVEGVERIKK